MSPDSFSSKEDAPSSVTSQLGMLDRVREYAATPPDALETVAREVLDAQWGVSPHPPSTAFAPATLSLISDHTHYSNGFALLMPVSQGAAVALRRTDRAGGVRIAFEDDSTVYRAEDGAERPVWVRIVEHTIAEVMGSGACADIAVVSTIPSSSTDAYLAAAAVAVARAAASCMAGAHGDDARTETAIMNYLPELRQHIATCTSTPFSVAFLVGAAAAHHSDPFTLVDTATREHLPVETAARDALAWSLIDPRSAPRDAAFHRYRRDQADEAIAILQERAFADLQSFRELEHQDIPRALNALPSRLTSVVRHMVTDNRRVQKMVAAMRRSDWQMIGALLLMSHASRRDEWGGTSAEADFIVEQVEAMTLDGIYGACMTGRGGYVILVGQPHALPLGIDQLKAAFEERFGFVPPTMSL